MNFSPQWTEASSRETIAVVQAMARQSNMDDETKGRLLHHVNGCAECQRAVHSLYAKGKK